ncbi:hypothetical protein BDV35DRAFT_178042 [Aspergillus flavus]|uniref:Uncharacterized protein n=1 Tax=Aspergillus flavus TaxID=5059 RepID=A0A5N6H1K7_ASPFL|nr:hypothetical protein BDV35DRAFT_178042 [Aspergillus flavus]
MAVSFDYISISYISIYIVFLEILSSSQGISATGKDFATHDKTMTFGPSMHWPTYV